MARLLSPFETHQYKVITFIRLGNDDFFENLYIIQ